MNSKLSNPIPKRVVCKYNDRRLLTLGKEYDVLEYNYPSYLLINDHGNTALYETFCFEVVEYSHPQFITLDLNNPLDKNIKLLQNAYKKIKDGPR